MKTFLTILAATLLVVPPLHAQVVADGATSTLSNVTNVIPGGVTVGTNGSFTLLVLSQNCLLTNLGQSEIGRNLTARSNEVRLISPTTRWHMLNPLNVGFNGSFNRLAISNGASVRSSQGTIGDSSASASNNAVVINGTGSEWSVPTSLSVGLVGGGNRLEVSDGGRMSADSAFIGTASSNNLALVTGSGSVWSSTDLTIGSSRSSNRLVVSNAGSVFVDGTVLLGNLASSSNNQLTVNGGTLRVTNALATGTLNVRRGTTTLDAGLIQVDRLLVTNSQGSFVLNGGTLSSRSTIATNGVSFDIGNNVGTAKFILAGNGTHTFTALTVDNLGTLTGNGTVVLPAPNLVVVLDTGTISPGAPIGKIAFNNQMLVFGTTLMEISRNGAILTNDQIQISGGLTHNGHLIVTNIGPTPLAAGDRFPLFSAPFATNSLLSLALPPLDPGFNWINKLSIDGSIQVAAFVVQTLPAIGVGRTHATLQGLANPAGANTIAWFEWGTSTNYGNTTAPQPLGSGVSNTNFSQAIPGLAPDTIHHFRAVASSSLGVAYGVDQGFVTAGNSVVLGGDINLITGPEFFPRITQTDSAVWSHSNTIVVAFSDSRGITNNPWSIGAVSVSTNRGVSFTRLPYLFNEDGACFGQPSLFYSVRAAKWYVSFLSDRCGSTSAGQWESADGLVWTDSGCMATNTSVDYLSTWVDNNPGSPFYGRQYAVFNDFNLANSPVLLTYSTNDGVNWSTPVIVSSSAFFQHALQITGSFGTDGTIFVPMLREFNGGLGQRQNYMARSTNGGLAFELITGSTFPAPGRSLRDNGYFVGMYSTPVAGYWTEMGWGQPGVGPGGVVHYVYTAGNPGNADPGNILYLRSTNNGTTWSTPLKLNTDTTTRGQWGPSLSVNAQGLLFVSWYDERNTANDSLERYGRASFDNGATWENEVAVSDVIFLKPLQPDFNVQPTYAGIFHRPAFSDDGYGDVAYHAWTDGRVSISNAPQQDVFFDKIFFRSPLKIDSIVRLENGDIFLEGRGFPNLVHTIQASTNPGFESFTTLDNLTVNPTGIWKYNVGQPTLTQRFYRVAYP